MTCFLVSALFLVFLFGKAENQAQHFCDVLQNASAPQIELQSLTSDCENLLLIESDRMYKMPLSNLDTKQDLLYLYNQEDGKLIPPVDWYRIPWIRLFEFYQNSPANLWWFTWLLSSDERKYRYYRVNDSYYLMKDKKDLYDPLAWPMDFRTVNDPKGGGYILGHVFMDNRIHATNKRVILTQMVFQEKEETVKVNYPVLCSADDLPIPLKSAYYFLETNSDRSVIYLRSPNATTRLNYRMDFFVLPPAGLLANPTDNKMYLFAEKAKRIYVLELSAIADAFTLLRDEVQIPILRSKSWTGFFKCNSVNFTEEDSVEPSQAEYIERVEEVLGTNSGRTWWSIFTIFLCIGMTLMACAPLWALVKERRVKTKAVSKSQTKKTSKKMSKSSSKQMKAQRNIDSRQSRNQLRGEISAFPSSL